VIRGKHSISYEEKGTVTIASNSVDDGPLFALESVGDLALSGLGVRVRGPAQGFGGISAKCASARLSTRFRLSL
jgi:hypothetical protein